MLRYRASQTGTGSIFVGILWLAGSAPVDLSIATQYRYRPRHAVPSLPVRMLRASQLRVSSLVHGGLDVSTSRSQPRSLSTRRIGSSWEPTPAPAGHVVSATSLGFASASPADAITLPLLRVA